MARSFLLRRGDDVHPDQNIPSTHSEADLKVNVHLVVF